MLQQFLAAMWQYILAGFLAGVVSIGIASTFHLNLPYVAIAAAGGAAFIAGIVPKKATV